WIYWLLQRFREGGYPALEPRSRRPHSCSHQAADAVQAEVLRLRAELLAAGHDGGPQTILGRLRHIPVGAAHKNRRVRLLVAGADVRIVTEDGQLLRALTLDPTRSYQPLGGRWPVYDVLQQVSTMS